MIRLSVICLSGPRAGCGLVLRHILVQFNKIMLAIKLKKRVGHIARYTRYSLASVWKIVVSIG